MAETVEPEPQTASEEPAAGHKPKRRSRKAAAAKTAPEPAEAGAEPAPVPTADNDSAENNGGELRRGWWQRTFG